MDILTLSLLWVLHIFAQPQTGFAIQMLAGYDNSEDIAVSAVAGV